jgi:REP element-mobilizing transposase RayT
MLRGIDRSQLFYDDTDRAAFIERLARYKDECGFSLYAYCLMGNHVHLLLKEGESGISEGIKRLATSYAHWFNARYDRTGYLFQNRFRSEPVQTNEYLLCVLRYILNNPAAAGLPAFSWTNHAECVEGTDSDLPLTDVAFVLGLFSDDASEARLLFSEFVVSDTGTPDDVSGMTPRKHIRDQDAIGIIKQHAHVKSCTDLADMDKDERNQVLVHLKSEGLSIRQLARLTGINRGIVLDAGKQTGL